MNPKWFQRIACAFERAESDRESPGEWTGSRERRGSKGEGELSGSEKAALVEEGRILEDKRPRVGRDLDERGVGADGRGGRMERRERECRGGEEEVEMSGGGGDSKGKLASERRAMVG